MNSNFDAHSFKQDDLHEHIVSVHICAFQNEDNSGDDGKPRSVRVDITGGYGDDGLRGKIDLASKMYEHTVNEVKTLSFRTIKPTTVEELCSLIVSKGRDRYRFTEELEGCRYWVSTIIKDLDLAGILPSGSGQESQEAVSYYWVFPKNDGPDGRRPRAVHQGTFY